MLFPHLAHPERVEALRFGERSLDYTQLAEAAGALAGQLASARSPVAVLAEARLESAIAVVAAMQAGVPAIPINPSSGEREVEHIVADSSPCRVLCAADAELPSAMAELGRIDVTAAIQAPSSNDTGKHTIEPEAGAPALIVYTAGTTGPPKGVVLARSAIASTLDALADAWLWSAEDVMVHALPLFHVHGLILGVLGPLRRGGTVHHTGRFSPEAIATAVGNRAAERPVVVFGVPTMYSRLAASAESDPGIAEAIGTARLLVSGSAPLPVRDHERITRATGQRVVERYGMTETLISTSIRVNGAHRPGTVGPPLDGVALRLVDEAGLVIDTRDGTTIGEIQVRGPNLFTEYLNNPEITAESFTDGWFHTGDMAVIETDGNVRIVGRKATDLISSGGYQIGAGEIENALLEHHGVADAAVIGEDDPDLGERVVAWVVCVPGQPGGPPDGDELIEHVAALLATHKRPRLVRFVEALPRNELGKVTKGALRG